MAMEMLGLPKNSLDVAYNVHATKAAIEANKIGFYEVGNKK